MIDILYASDIALTTRKVAGLVNHPKTTTERALEDLDAHGVIDRNGDEQGQAFTWTLSDLARAAYTLATTEPEMSEGAIRRVPNDPISAPSDTSPYEPSRVQDDFSGSVTPIPKTCPDGHMCSLMAPTGSPLCCGHPVEVER